MNNNRLLLDAADIFGWFFVVFLAAGAWQSFTKTHSIQTLGVLLINCIFVVLYFLRRKPKAVTALSFAWAMGFLGTCLPFLLRPSEPAIAPAIVHSGLAVQTAGIALVIIALLSLRRSFGIVPANRGIQKDGLYRLVRHPLYAAELLSLGGFVISNPSPANITILFTEILIQYSRARMEEHLLCEDPDYRDYLGQTRYRFFPGLL